MASVLEGFLVSLGFDIDKDGLAKFNGIVAEAGKRFIDIGKAAVGAGVAIGTAFAASSKEVNDLYKVSNNTGTSIQGLLGLQGAVERVGGSAENVSAAFQEFAMKSKTYGSAFEQMVTQQLGVRLRKANGEARDMSDVFVDMSKKLAALAKVDPGLARMKAEAVGLGGIFDDIVKGDFPAELERAQHFAGLFGKEIDSGANASHRLTTEIGQVWDTVKQGAMSATAQVTEALQLDKKLADFNDSFGDFLKSTIDSQVQIIKDASGFFDWVGKVLFDSGDYYDDSRRKVLKERIDSGKATDEEKEEYEGLVQEKKSNGIADSAHIDRDVAQQMGLADKWNDTDKLKAEFFGVDPKDEKAMAALKDREVKTEDLLQYAENGETPDSDRFMIGLELQKRQREAAKQKAQALEQKSAKPKQKAKEQIDDQIEDLHTPKPKAPVEEVKADAAEAPAPTMQGSALKQEAANTAAGAAKASTINNQTDNSRHQQTTKTEVKIEQNITVNGAGDPKEAAHQIATMTGQEVRNQTRGVS